MERGEIWLVSLDPTAGHEQQGTRPVLIVTPAAFNRVTRLPVVVPVTSGGNFARTAGFAVSLDGVGIRTRGLRANGTKTYVKEIIRCLYLNLELSVPLLKYPLAT